MRSQKLGHTQTGCVRVAGHCSVFAEGSPGRSAWAMEPLSQQAADLSALTGFVSAASDSPHLPTAGRGGVWTSMKPEFYEGQKKNCPHFTHFPICHFWLNPSLLLDLPLGSD